MPDEKSVDPTTTAGTEGAAPPVKAEALPQRGSVEIVRTADNPLVDTVVVDGVSYHGPGPFTVSQKHAARLLEVDDSTTGRGYFERLSDRQQD